MKYFVLVVIFKIFLCKTAFGDNDVEFQENRNCVQDRNCDNTQYCDHTLFKCIKGSKLGEECTLDRRCASKV